MAAPHSSLDPVIADPAALVGSLVTSVRGPLGVGHARQRLDEMRRGTGVIDGLPAPLALMLAGHDGGWMDQQLLSGTGRTVNSTIRIWKTGLAKRHLGLMRWAATWPDQEVARDMLALGWLALVERVEHPGRGRGGDANADARLAWTAALEKATALATRRGLPTPEALLDRAMAQLRIQTTSTDRGWQESHRWGKHAPRVALLCAHAFPPGMGAASESFWLSALDVLRRTGTGWNPARGPDASRLLARSTITAVAGRLAHPRLRQPPASMQAWVQALGVEGATEALVQCWVVAAQPTNPAVPLPEDPPAELAGAWTQAVQRHIQEHPDQVLRLPSLVAELSWHDRPMWDGLAPALDAMRLEQALPGPATQRSPSLRL